MVAPQSPMMNKEPIVLIATIPRDAAARGTSPQYPKKDIVTIYTRRNESELGRNR